MTCLSTRLSWIVFPCRTSRIIRGVDFASKLRTHLATLPLLEWMANLVRILLVMTQRRSDRALLMLVLFVIMPRLASQWHLSELAGLASSLIPLAVLRNASDLTRGFSL